MDEYQSHLEVNVRTFGSRDENEEYRWQKTRVEQVCAILRELPRKEIGADVGCMSGMATAQYAATGFKTFHGYDISHASLEKLQAKGFQAYYWNADGGRCPMPDHTYDVIIAGEIIEHLVDTDSFAQEIHRVLKPGGYAIITTPNLASWYNRVRLLRGLPPRCYPGTSSTVRKDPLIDNHHIRINIMSEWRHFFESHRFKVVRTVGTSHLDVLAGGWKTRMLQGIDHLASRFPSLAVGLIFVVQTEPGAS